MAPPETLVVAVNKIDKQSVGAEAAGGFTQFRAALAACSDWCRPRCAEVVQTNALKPSQGSRPCWC